MTDNQGSNILRHIVCEDGDSMLVLGTVPEPDATMFVTLTHRIGTHEDGYKQAVVLDRGQAVALRDALDEILSAGREGVYGFRTMEKVWFYVYNVTDTYCGPAVNVLGKLPEDMGYVDVIIDMLGISPFSITRNRPSMAGLKPYILLESLDEAMPYFDRARKDYIETRLADVGLIPRIRPYRPDEGFMDAVRTDDGITVLSSHLIRNVGIQYTLTTLEADSRRLRKVTVEDGTEGMPALEGDHLSEDECRHLLTVRYNGVWDRILDEIRGWCGC